MSVMIRYCVSSVLLLSLFPISLIGQTDHPANDREVLVQTLIVNGVRSIDTTELNDITSQLTGALVNDNNEEILERLRFAFQDHGYFDAEIQSIRIRVADPLAKPKPITVEAEVREGAVFRIGEIRFSGNHAIASDELRSAFPIHKDAIFHRTMIGRGLEALRDAYARLGYIDFACVPDAPKSSATTVDLAIEVEEGRQYRMGRLEIAGDSNAAEQLRLRWELEKGQPFDESYLKKFLDDNQSLLPSGFNVSRALAIIRNCPDTSVAVFIDLDPKHPSQPPKEVSCNKGGEVPPK